MSRKKPKAPKGESLVTPEQVAQQQALTQQATDARTQEVELLRQQTEMQQQAFQRQLVLQEEQARALEQSRAQQEAQLGLLVQQQNEQRAVLENQAEAQSATTTERQSRGARQGSKLTDIVTGQRNARQTRQQNTRRVVGSRGGRSGDSLFRMF